MVPVRPAASGLAAVAPRPSGGRRPAADADGSRGGRAEPGRLQEVPSGDARHYRPAGLPR